MDGLLGENWFEVGCFEFFDVGEITFVGACHGDEFGGYVLGDVDGGFGLVHDDTA